MDQLQHNLPPQTPQASPSRMGAVHSTGVPRYEAELRAGPVSTPTQRRRTNDDLDAMPSDILVKLMRQLDTTGVSNEEWWYHCDQCVCGLRFTKCAF